MRNKNYRSISRKIAEAIVSGSIVLMITSAPLFAITPSDQGAIVAVPDSAFQIINPVVYVVQPGDNLHWLAAKFYGNARMWVNIYEANRAQLQDPNILEKGQKLKIMPNI